MGKKTLRTYPPTASNATPDENVNGNAVLGAVLRDVTGLQEDGKAGDPVGTYVPANGLAAPMQMKDSSGNPFVRDVYRDVTGLQEDGKAYDPFGTLIANVQPPSGGPPPTQPFYGATYAGVSWNSFINANNLSSGCRLDGVRTGCTSVLNQLAHGNANLVSLSTTGTLADFLNTVGTIPRSITHSRYVDPSSHQPPDHSNDPDRGDVIVTNTDAELLGHWEYWEEYIGMEPLNNPQNTGGQFAHPQVSRHVIPSRNRRLAAQKRPYQLLSECVKKLLTKYFDAGLVSSVHIHTNGIGVVEWTKYISGPKGAVTWGNDVYFPEGLYDRITSVGISKIAHEVAHVGQFAELGKAQFAAIYIKSYAENIDRGMSGTEAYENDVLELGPEALEKRVLSDLRSKYGDRNPCAH